MSSVNFLRRLLTALLLPGVLLCGANKGNCSPPGPPATVESVIQAWERRQSAVRSFQFSWEATQWWDRGRVPGAVSGATSAKEALPDAMSYKTRTTFAMDAQGRTRHEAHAMSWNSEVNRLVPTTSIEVCDGRIRRRFSPEGPTNRFEGVGEIPCGLIDQDVASVGQLVYLLPIRLVFRPFDQRIGNIDRRKLVVTGRHGVADGCTCLVIEQGDQTFWVDPNRSFIPLRNFRSNRGVAVRQVDIHYSEDKEWGWIPTAWTIMLLNPKDGKLTGSTVGKVTDYKINPPLPEGTFEITFPPGTWVRDLVKNENYILREGAARRPVLAGEWDGRNYEQIRDSEPPGLSSGWKVFIASVSVLVLGGAVVWWLVARRRRASR